MLKSTSTKFFAALKKYQKRLFDLTRLLIKKGFSSKGMGHERGWKAVNEKLTKKGDLELYNPTLC